jgi:hypothetical protein
MDTIVTIMFGSVLLHDDRTELIELRRIRKNLKSKQRKNRQRMNNPVFDLARRSIH